MIFIVDEVQKASGGEVPDAGTWIAGLVTALTPVTLAVIALYGGKRNNDGKSESETAEIRERVETRHGVDSSGLDDVVLRMFDRYDKHIDRLNERSDLLDEKVTLLERREDALLEYIEDLKQGVEQRRYPPWPPVPH